MVEARHIKLSGMRAANHIKIEIKRDPRQRHWRVLHKRVRAEQAFFLCIEGGKNDVVLRRSGLKMLRNRRQSRHARGIIVGAIVDLTVLDAQMVIMRGQYEDRPLAGRFTCDPPDDINAANRFLLLDDAALDPLSAAPGLPGAELEDLGGIYE